MLIVLVVRVISIRMRLRLGGVVEAPFAPKPSNSKLCLSTTTPANVPSRGLQEATLAYFGVGVVYDESTGEQTQLIIPVYQKGELNGEKEIGLLSKSFTARGDTKSPDLFGQKQVGSGGKLLIITEGEIDCMSARQMLMQAGKSYNVVSLPNGANVAAIRKNIEWVEGFDTVTLNLDNDDIGKACAIEIAELLTPGKAKIMSLPVKDANEYLTKEIGGYLNAVWNAKPYRPDGIVAMSDTWDLLFETWDKPSVKYPWSGVNKKYYGLRGGELVTLTAGTGVGKSQVTRELQHHLLMTTKDNIGVLALEEKTARTAWGVMAVEANLPLGIREEQELHSKEDIKKWYDATMGLDRLYSLDHRGAVDKLLSNVRYLIKGLGCKWIFLDHLHMIIAAMSSESDERKAIDHMMFNLAALASETDAGLILVSHLKRIEGNRGHEQGVRVDLAHLRGSQSIAQLSDAVIAFERNQQADDPKEANLTTVRALKNRYAGPVGICTYLAYQHDTGRLVEIHDKALYLAPTEEEAGC